MALWPLHVDIILGYFYPLRDSTYSCKHDRKQNVFVLNITLSSVIQVNVFKIVFLVFGASVLHCMSLR